MSGEGQSAVAHVGEFASGGQIEVSLEFGERVKASAFEGGGEVLVFFEIDAEPMWQGGLEAAFDDGVESDLLSGVRLGVGAGGGGAIERADFKNSGIGDAVFNASRAQVRQPPTTSQMALTGGRQYPL